MATLQTKGFINTSGDKFEIIPSEHTHVLANITDLDTLTTEIGNKANKSHGHTIDNITNLQSTLNNKADKSHYHTVEQITNIDKVVIPVIRAEYLESPDGERPGDLDPIIKYGIYRVIYSYKESPEENYFLFVNWNIDSECFEQYLFKPAETLVRRTTDGKIWTKWEGGSNITKDELDYNHVIGKGSIDLPVEKISEYMLGVVLEGKGLLANLLFNNENGFLNNYKGATFHFDNCMLRYTSGDFHCRLIFSDNKIYLSLISFEELPGGYGKQLLYLSKISITELDHIWHESPGKDIPLQFIMIDRDYAVKENSDNLITSGAVYAALNNKLDKKEIDSIPSNTSGHLVYSDGVYNALLNRMPLKPIDDTTLTNDATHLASSKAITTAINNRSTSAAASALGNAKSYTDDKCSNCFDSSRKYTDNLVKIIADVDDPEQRQDISFITEFKIRDLWKLETPHTVFLITTDLTKLGKDMSWTQFIEMLRKQIEGLTEIGMEKIQIIVDDRYQKEIDKEHQAPGKYFIPHDSILSLRIYIKTYVDPHFNPFNDKGIPNWTNDIQCVVTVFFDGIFTIVPYQP